MANTNSLRIGDNTPTSLMYGSMKEDSTTIYPSTEEVWDAYYGDTLVYHKDKTVENCWVKYKMAQIDSSGCIDIVNNIAPEKTLSLPSLDTNLGNVNYANLLRIQCSLKSIDTYYIPIRAAEQSGSRRFFGYRKTFQNSNIGSVSALCRNSDGEIVTETKQCKDITDNANVQYRFRNSNADKLLLQIGYLTEDVQYFAANCRNLTSLRVEPKIEKPFSENCQFLRFAQGCTSLTSFHLTWKTTYVETYNGAFGGCSSMQVVTCEDPNEYSFWAGDYRFMFRDCKKLQNVIPIIITISKSGDFIDPTYLDSIFMGCSELSMFTLYPGLPTVPTSSNKAYHYYFVTPGTTIPTPPNMDMYQTQRIRITDSSKLSWSIIENLINYLQETNNYCALHIPDYIGVSPEQISAARSKNWYIYSGDRLLE